MAEHANVTEFMLQHAQSVSNAGTLLCMYVIAVLAHIVYIYILYSILCVSTYVCYLYLCALQSQTQELYYVHNNNIDTHSILYCYVYVFVLFVCYAIMCTVCSKPVWLCFSTLLCGCEFMR